MSFHSWLQNLRSALASSRGQPHPRRRGSPRAGTHRLNVEFLEDRLTPSFSVLSEFAIPASAVKWGSSSSHLADVTSDGVRDRIELIPYQVVVRPGRGNGTFGDPIRSDGQYAYTMALADFNGDTRLDVFTLNYPGSGTGTWGSVLLGRGDGTFSYSGSYGFGSSMNAALSIGFGDFLGTGRTDVVVAGHDGADENVFVVLLNNGDWGSLPPPPPPDLWINDLFSNSAIKEGNTGVVSATFTVTLSLASTETITVAYVTGDDTAIAGIDYQPTSGTLTFAPGETSKTITVPVIGDRLFEIDEYFSVNLIDATGATIADGQGFGTIMDNEPRISISDVSKQEGKKNQKTRFTFTVTLSAAYDQPVTMSFQTVNGTATTSDGDYAARTGTLTFAPGEKTKTITIEIKGDSKKEASETFYLELFDNSSHSLFTKTRGIGTILNDD